MGNGQLLLTVECWLLSSYLGLQHSCYSQNLSIASGWTATIEKERLYESYIVTQTKFQIQAFWDSKAQVWVATSDEIPGLATEASTLEFLTQKLRDMITELVTLNKILPANYVGSISFNLISYRQELIELLNKWVHLLLPIKKILSEAGCYFIRQGKGDHEIWYSPITEQIFVVDSSIKSRHTANAVLKEAGLKKAY